MHSEMSTLLLVMLALECMASASGRVVVVLATIGFVRVGMHWPQRYLLAASVRVRDCLVRRWSAALFTVYWKTPVRLHLARCIRAAISAGAVVQ